MSQDPADYLPEFREWSLAAVPLLQGVVYSDAAEVWNILLASRTQLEDYFGTLGLLLVIDEAEGYAYLRQLSGDELPDGYDRLPKLLRKARLGYEPTLLCVILREELRRFEEEEIHNERCVVSTDILCELWCSLFPAHQDEVKLRKGLASALNKLEELKFVRRFGSEPEEWEIRRVLKARLPAAELENLKTQLLDATQRRSERNGSDESGD